MSDHDEEPLPSRQAQESVCLQQQSSDRRAKDLQDMARLSVKRIVTFQPERECQLAIHTLVWGHAPPWRQDMATHTQVATPLHICFE